ncbi:MAG TPA: type IX secretion system sortase PorU, partial [Bacteroidia bacterium]|nr:type IX secretion system sortase PorU [Bacteroidia bacterium]
MKKTSLILTLTIIFGFGLLFGQKQKELSKEISNLPISIPVSKTEFIDNSVFPVKLSNADYDLKKSNMPYFSESKIILKNNSVKVNLINVKTVVLSGEVSQKLMTLYRPYLNSEFSIQIQYGQSARDHMAYSKITPYRINSENQIEELTAYNVEWTTAESDISTQKIKRATTFGNNSVLANGNWYKLGVTKSGIYKLDKTFLKSVGIDVTTINPKNIRIYSNGGHALPENNSAYRLDDLHENAIKVIGEADNVFDPADYVLFYGQETNEWVYDPAHTLSCLNFCTKQNYFSDTSYYYLTTDLGLGKRIADRVNSLSPATNTTTAYDYYDFHEQNTTNFIKSGTEFYGEYFDFTTTFNFSFPIQNLVVNDTVAAFAKVAARGLSPSLYSFAFSGSSTTFTTGTVNTNDYLAPYVAIASTCDKALCNSSSLISFNITKQTAGNIGWLDKILFNCRRSLTFNNLQFPFRDCRTIGTGNLTNYVFNTNGFGNISVWDVSDITNVTNQQFNLTGNSLDFTMNNDSLKEYVIFNGSDYLTPGFVTKVINQNLHSIAQADYVIVAYPGFLSQAQKLAQIHQQYEGLTSAVVTSDQIYNEFSSGRPDPVAIRDFVRMLYNRNLSSGKEVKYLLLYGDGSYKVKDRYASNNSSMLPVWEVGGNPKDNSWDPTISTVCDDFYGWMNDAEGDDWSSALVDIGVGRFPVRNLSEAIIAVNKVEAYYRKNYNFSVNEIESSCSSASTYPLGDWRNWICFIADDGDNQAHMSATDGADALAIKVKGNHPEYNIDKLYADAFLRYSTPGGYRYPDVSSGIDHRFEKGTLILNYTGHGGEVGLSHNRFLEISQIEGYKNINNMPLFVTATCEFSRFDDPDRTSAGELCFLNPNGAAIALLTTVRLAFSNTNFTLNSNLYSFVFDTLPNGKMPSLGDVVRLTKRASAISFYYLNFHLLGDPALQLAYPQQRVYTSQINKTVITPTAFDTLKALSKVTVKGFVGDKNGNKLTSFNGILFPTVFDKEQQITCLGNDPSSLVGGLPFQFYLQKNIIYKGKVQVNNGDFSFSFIVPKDISYNYGIGKLSYYAHNGVIDANGYNKNFYVGGSSATALVDNVGPSVSLFLNDKKFVSGGTTNDKPNLYAEVSDSSGINTVGTGIGHDLTAILDENSNKPIILNDYYEANLNSYQSGKVKYPFDQLSEGNHRLSLKVWDVRNNS